MSGRTVTATQARVRFGEILRDVTRGAGAIVVERQGRPQAVILSYQEYQRLLARVDHGWREGLGRALSIGARIARRRKRVPLPAPEDVLTAGREERQKDVLGMS